MRLLIITQKVDINDDNLGFFHQWIEKFANRLDTVYVICLWQGEHNLPKNVVVRSMGKERGVSKIGQFFRLQKHLLKILGQVDGIFVHMCPIYALASSVLAKIFRKEIILWYAHVETNLSWIERKIVSKIFTPSQDSFSGSNKKVVVSGHGIDIDVFKPKEAGELASGPSPAKTILHSGRIAPVKDLETLIGALDILVHQKQRADVKVRIIGSAKDDYEKTYFAKLKNMVQEKRLENNVEFLQGVSNKEMVRFYQQSHICVDMTKEGGAGKSVLEAMACGTPVVLCTETFNDLLGDFKREVIFEEKHPQDFAQKLLNCLNFSEEKRNNYSNLLRSIVAEHHNLDALIDKIIISFKRIYPVKSAKGGVPLSAEQFNRVTVCYFGIYDPTNTRNRELIKGLKENNVEVVECQVEASEKYKYWKLFKKHRKIKNYDFMIVGFPGHTVMPLARVICRKPIVFDLLVSLYDAIILDRKTHSRFSPQALKYWLLDWLSAKLADVVILESNKYIKYFINKFRIKKKKFRRVLLPADDSIFYPRDCEKSTDKFLVLFQGTYLPLQGVEYIIRAAKLLEKQGIQFNIIGKIKEYQPVIDLVQALNINNVNFIDFMPQKELAEHIAQADVCLGFFGNVPRAQMCGAFKISDALSMKKPLITADTASIREFLKDGQSCLLCRIADARDLAEKILELKNNPQLRRKIAENGYKIYKEKLSSKVLGKQLKNILPR